ncbi:uncharacterized protein A4U43_C07F13320 [Asparagus officinalis]|uniref:Uncharacterized protein n=1 Tax=Asparagus officinalis TaxID=4686 RepID=A0A5P1EBP0_ASPOF|nr:uncharacterized protein A4U43_C07F13320 [Asparagus officinalis]
MKEIKGALDVEGDSDRRPLVIEVAPSSGGTRDRRRDLADSVDVRFAGESSPIPEPSRWLGKEPLAPVDEMDGADESSPGPGGTRGFIRAGSIPPTRTHTGRRETISSRQSRTIQELEQEVDALRSADDSSLAAARRRPGPSSGLGHAH